MRGAASRRSIKVSLNYEELRLIEDALTYYRVCTENDGPDDYPVADIRRVERWIGRYVLQAMEA